MVWTGALEIDITYAQPEYALFADSLTPLDGMTELHSTLLSDWHKDHGAKMDGFGGYQMPLWYKTGPIKEHRAVIQQAGLFDTSHMSQLLIEGPESFELLQKILTKDLESCIGKGLPLERGRATYGFIALENGFLLDDAIVMMEDTNTYLLVANAGMGGTIKNHLQKVGADLDVAVSDLTGKLCKMDLQGPASIDILMKVLKPSKSMKAPFPYFSFVGHYDHLQEGVQSHSGYSVMVSRTGYTGEVGFELYVRPNAFVPLWEELLAAGADQGLIPCGLGARDSLRTGAGLPLSHQDLGDWPIINHPWEFAISRTDGDFSKNFVGAEALREKGSQLHTYSFLGENGRKVDGHSEVLLDEQVIGTVLTCATDMAIDRVDGQLYSLNSPDAPEDFKPKGLSCGFVRVDQELSEGQVIHLKDKRRSIPVTITKNLRPHRTARMKWPL
ncbi:aminomethyltransferase family protein [Kiritimatiellota bacterium B12222]|nr:aminomethyltransferase family protein [Kiritimatiellota bacterium B12222]